MSRSWKTGRKIRETQTTWKTLKSACDVVPEIVSFDRDKRPMGKVATHILLVLLLWRNPYWQKTQLLLRHPFIEWVSTSCSWSSLGPTTHQDAKSCDSHAMAPVKNMILLYLGLSRKVGLGQVTCFIFSWISQYFIDKKNIVLYRVQK